MKDKVIREVYQVLEDRRDNPIDSYTSNLMKDDEKLAEDKILEERARMGEDVSSELENLIKNYDEAKKHAELLLKQVDARKRALKVRSLNLPVMFEDESSDEKP